jgi:sugar/nucleoside kinase (ribokinase family)
VSTPDFVVIGHVVRDVTPEGWRLGGTATFAAVQAQRLGLSAGIVTRMSADVSPNETLPGVQFAGRPSEYTTSFENSYERGRRRQRVPEQAAPVEPRDVPAEWQRAPVSLVGPVCGEVPPDMTSALSSPLVGVSAQGWLRVLDRDRRVRRRAWRNAPFWNNAHVLFVSREDLGRRPDQVDRWIDHVPIVVLTRDRGGARVHEQRQWRAIDAFPAREVDPTGAGDIFAAAFLVRYHETSDTAHAMRFAGAAAACAVEAPGIERVATRDVIEQRMRHHPEIDVR